MWYLYVVLNDIKFVSPTDHMFFHVNISHMVTSKVPGFRVFEITKEKTVI